MAVSLKKANPTEYTPEHIMTEEEAIASYKRNASDNKPVDYAAVEYAVTHKAEMMAKLQADIEAEKARIAEKEKELEARKKEEAELDAQLAIFREGGSLPVSEHRAYKNAELDRQLGVLRGFPKGAFVVLIGALLTLAGLYWTALVPLALKPEFVKTALEFHWVPKTLGLMLMAIGSFKLISALMQCRRW